MSTKNKRGRIGGYFAKRLSEKQCTELGLAYHGALLRLEIGLGDSKDLWTLTSMMEIASIGMERSSQFTSKEKLEKIEFLRETFKGVMRAVWRGENGSNYGLDGETMIAMRDICTEHDIQVKRASLQEVDYWIEEARRRAMKGGEFSIDSNGNKYDGVAA